MIRLIPIFLLLFTISGFSQDEPKAILIDEFSAINCEDFSYRLDNAYAQLLKSPDARLVFVLFGETGNLRKNLFFKGMIVGYFKRWKLEKDKFDFIHSEFRDKMEMQAWIVPTGASMPQMPLTEWSYRLDKADKPYKFTWLNEFDDICPDVDGLGLYADVLKANPSFRANIVIRDLSRANSKRLERMVISELVRTRAVNRKQVRFFHVREQSTGVDQRVEYWLFPPK